MPIAMIAGIALYPYVSRLAGIIPWFIFLMLLITYAKMDLKQLRLRKMHLWLILIQVFGSIAVYLLLRPIHPVLAQGAAVVVMAPTATSAPVIVRMLDGDVESVTAFSLLSNLVVIAMSPLFFSFMGSGEGFSFWISMVEVFKHVALLLLLPLIIAVVLQKLSPKASEIVGRLGFISFYLWAIALVIVIGKTMHFITLQDSSHYLVEIWLGIVTLILALAQFRLGRKIGSKYNETVSGGQGLGQKNTILVIWMSQTFLNPLSSIGPGAYVIWQNTINSWQIWRKNNKR